MFQNIGTKGKEYFYFLLKWLNSSRGRAQVIFIVITISHFSYMVVSSIYLEGTLVALFMSAWGNDIFFACCAYLSILFWIGIPSSRRVSVLLWIYIFVLASIAELLQIWNFPLKGYFDFPWDFIAYAVGCTLALLLDVFWIQKRDA